MGADALPTAAEIRAWTAASRKVDVRIEVRIADGIQTINGDTPVPKGRWYAVIPITPPVRRYLFVLQWQVEEDFILMHFVDGAGARRVPPGNGWMRALDTGKLHVISSDVALTRIQIAAIIGGRAPIPGTVEPPNS
jgi:hypothetical protein